MSSILHFRQRGEGAEGRALNDFPEHAGSLAQIAAVLASAYALIKGWLAKKEIRETVVNVINEVMPPKLWEERHENTTETLEKLSESVEAVSAKIDRALTVRTPSVHADVEEMALKVVMKIRTLEQKL